MLILYYFLISFCLIGYGNFLSKILKINSNNLGELGLLGISFLIFISYISSFFITHNYLFNSIILLFGLLYLILSFKKLNFKKKELIIFFSTFSILILFIMVGKNHDDFSYYHFPYSIILTEFSHPIGLGLLNNGFRNPSSIFFLNSIFYLPKIDYYLFHISSAYFLGFSNIILFKSIISKNYFNLNNKFINYFSLLSLIFINVFFYRLAEYGTDRSAQIIVIIIIQFFLIIINSQNQKQNDSLKLTFLIMILLSLVVSIKPFFIIYSPLILILFFIKKNINFIKNIFFSRTFIYCSLFTSLFFFYNLINSGCLIFPATFTCFSSFPWTIDLDYIQAINIWYELWSKAGASPTYVVEDKLNYISNFNWLGNWINNYFFNKVSDFLAGLFTLSLISILFFYNKKKVIYKYKYKLIYFFLIFVFFVWFLKHPALRYGGYQVIALLFIIPTCVFLTKFNYNYENFYKKSLILIIFGLIIFLSRNTNRLIKEYNQYSYIPYKNLNYVFTEKEEFYFRYVDLIYKNKKKYNKINFLNKEFIIIRSVE